MSLYFMHLHECGTVTVDEDGAEFEDRDQAHAAALRAAREMMCSELQQGHLCLSCHIEVVEPAAERSFKVEFRDAVVISGR